MLDLVALWVNHKAKDANKCFKVANSRPFHCTISQVFFLQKYFGKYLFNFFIIMFCSFHTKTYYVQPNTKNVGIDIGIGNFVANILVIGISISVHL